MAPDASDAPSDSLIKRRVSKACDNCRIMKSRCERDSVDQDCRRCEQEGLDCTSDAPVKRRGPPKGYLQLVETRLHELEAVTGVLLSSPDPSIRNVFNTLSQDPFANNVLTQVANGAFGPRALAKYATQHDTNPDGAMSSPPSSQQLPHGGPTNNWQLQAVRTMVARSQASQSFQSPAYSQTSVSESVWDTAFFGNPQASTTSQSSNPQIGADVLQQTNNPYAMLEGQAYDALFHPGQSQG